MSRIRPIRVELWRDGEIVDQAVIGALGVLDHELKALPGDQISTIWEDDSTMYVARPMTIAMVGGR